MYLLLFVGEGPACTMTTDEVEAQADHCNKKKKAAKTVEVSALHMSQRSAQVYALTSANICIMMNSIKGLPRLIWTSLKLVPPGMNFSATFGPTLKNLFPL